MRRDEVVAEIAEFAFRSLLHPRTPRGRRGGGQFRDVLGQLARPASGRANPALGAKLKPGGKTLMGDLPDGTVIGTPDGRVAILRPGEGKPTYGDKTYVVAYDIATGERFEPPAWLPPAQFSSDPAVIKAAAAKLTKLAGKPKPPAPQALTQLLGPAPGPSAKTAAGKSGALSPSNPQAAEARMVAASALLEHGGAEKNAVLKLVAPSKERDGLVAGLTTGDVGRALKEYRYTPTGDLEVLGGINVESVPVYGQANCNLATRVLTMGSTSAIGDFRHELGHAIRSAMGGGGGPGAKTPLTKWVAARHEETMAKAVEAKKPATPKPPFPEAPALKQAYYEEVYGAIDPRSLDSWEEDAAEQYRAYHKAVFQTTNTQTPDHDPGALEHYRATFPKWAQLWDAWYTAQLKEAA